MTEETDILAALQRRFSPADIVPQAMADGMPACWTPLARLPEVLAFLKHEAPAPYPMLYDLTAIDERVRRPRPGQPAGDFTVQYELLSLERNQSIRVKVALAGEYPSVPTVTRLWPNADWYERELYDMFGIKVDGHPNLRRILMPPWWRGHPLRKDHYARATEVPPFALDDAQTAEQQQEFQFRPEEWGLPRPGAGADFMYLNFGPHHPGTHGVLRLVLQLDDEEIVNVVPDIGFHHRGVEKMGERQTWHSYIPYTDRVDYLAGVLNNFGYVLSVEKLAGIEVPDRVKVIRIMTAELCRIASHLVWYGTFAQDLGQMSPVFYMFNDRERIMDIMAAITGARMHPSYFRIGGVAWNLPKGWEELVGDFLRYMPARLDDYDKLVMRNRILKGRTVGVGAVTRQEAIDWGCTGPNLRATGLEYDFRKKRPYSGYDQFQFDIPTAEGGDCYARALVRVEEMRQSLRIIQQCVENMPAGEHKSRHKLTTPPLRAGTMHDIETLINHFLGVSWGPVMPAGEAGVATESAKGATTYFLVSDGGTMSYRTRVRTPSFPHIQMLPLMSRGEMIPDLIAILGSIDFVLADVDR